METKFPAYVLKVLLQLPGWVGVLGFQTVQFSEKGNVQPALCPVPDVLL